MTRLRLSLCVLATALLIPAPALAATVDVSALYGSLNDALMQILTALIPLAVAWILYMTHQLLLRIPLFGRLFGGNTFETNLADGLNRAFQNGTALALNKLQAWETVHKDVAVQGQVQALAAQYVADHAPQALAHFGFSENEIADRVLSYLPRPPAITLDTTGAIVKTAPVSVQPLPAI